MAINKKLIHFNNFSTFNSQKLSANSNNNQYTEGVNGEIKSGVPDILYQSICYIKDTKQQWTHGQLYDCSSLISGENIKTINGESIVGSGDITISGGSSDANVQAVAIGESVDDVIPTNYYVLPFTVNQLMDLLNAREYADLSEVISSTEALKIAQAIKSNKLIYLPDEYGGYVVSTSVGYEIADDGVVFLYIMFKYIDVNVEISGYSDKGFTLIRLGNQNNWYILHPEEGGVYSTQYCSGTVIAEGVLTSDNTLMIGFSEVSMDFILHFITGETLPEIQTYGIFWPNGLMPQLEPNTQYELSVTRGYTGNSSNAVLTPFKPVE